MSTRLTVVIAVPLDAGQVARLRADSRLDVRHDPDLLPPPRFACDHRGDPGFSRSTQQQNRYAEQLAGAQALFGIPGEDPAQLGPLVRGGAPRLRLVQATAAGAGEQVARAGLTADELDRVAVCSGSGVHGGPLAEFALLGLLAFTRGLPRLVRDRQDRRWEHYATPELAGRTLVVLGTGAIGGRVAELARAFGMHVIGVNSTGHRTGAAVDEVVAPDELAAVAARAHALVITVPATEDTAGLVSGEVLAALPTGAVLVNIGRGQVVDEEALIAALRDGRLAGAALDVAAHEPPAADSPLWTLPNVILSPHTAALSPREDERLVELFADNLTRLLEGRPLRNRIDRHRGY